MELLLMVSMPTWVSGNYEGVVGCARRVDCRLVHARREVLLAHLARVDQQTQKLQVKQHEYHDPHPENPVTEPLLRALQVLRFGAEASKVPVEQPGYQQDQQEVVENLPEVDEWSPSTLNCYRVIRVLWCKFLGQESLPWGRCYRCRRSSCLCNSGTWSGS